MISKTISITIPEKLEKDLQKQADLIGISRSRFIGNLLLEWQKTKVEVINDCIFQEDGNCSYFGWECEAPQVEAESCVEYKK